MSKGSGGTPLSVNVESEHCALIKRIQILSQKKKERRGTVERSASEPTDLLPPKAEDSDLSAPNAVAEEKVDFFVPTLTGKGTRDSQGIMDVATFRLSKKEKRVGEILRHELSDGYVEVSAGAHGMATVWDYDIVLMMVSHLTEAMDLYREGKGSKPSRVFRPRTTDILQFARRGDGSRQAEEIEAALDRLRNTTIKTRRDKGKLRITEAEGLITRYRVLSRTDTKKIRLVEIEVPEWIYREVVSSKRPTVLSVHPDYFLIRSGIGRFIYRLARRCAGQSSAKWSFETLYKRSGSSGTAKRFFQNLRAVIQSNNLPEYTLLEQPGNSGPQLVMKRRSSLISPPRNDQE